MTFVSDDERGIVGVYAGGTIRTGQVVARRREDRTVEMLYQCVTVSQELKAGRALARFSRTPDKTLCMHLDWQWLTGDQSAGVSEWRLETDESASNSAVHRPDARVAGVQARDRGR